MNLQELANPNMGVFAAIGGVAALAALGVVAFNNAVRSALCLVVCFFMLAFLYFTLSAEMIGILQIVVYTGAIMVLFLFVIMLLNLGSMKSLLEERDPKMIIGGALGLAMAALLGSQVIAPLASVTEPRSGEGFGTPQSVGYSLFSTYLYPFE
ncbi:MAG: NADH-quinone oxidoreductase subunit J, partial [Chlorobia bacterium]|nr:NADH-quinone oxidoreductase subunit J [Fimbriimonadaceae bacterium]